MVKFWDYKNDLQHFYKFSYYDSRVEKTYRLICSVSIKKCVFLRRDWVENRILRRIWGGNCIFKKKLRCKLSPIEDENEMGLSPRNYILYSTLTAVHSNLLL